MGFSCNIKDIRAAVAHLRVALPKGKQARIEARVEISIKPYEVTLSVIGASFTIVTHTGIFAKIFMPVLVIMRAVETAKSPIFVIQCESGKAQLNDMEISSSEIEL